MSVIVTKVYENRITIAADSQYTYGETKKFTSKLVTTPNLVLGYSGPATQLTKMHAHLAKEGRDEVRPTVEGVHHFFQAFDAYYGPSAEGYDRCWHLVTQGQAFSYIEGHILEIEDYDAIGSGRDYAIAALWLGCPPCQAVETAIAHNIFCGGPVQEAVIPK